MKKGFTLIELLVTFAILAIFIIIALFSYRYQLSKGRDARRKADLDKIQNILEDFANDNASYPSGFSCGNTTGTSLDGYAREIPCDPLNNAVYNYFYSYDSTTGKKSWYKIFSKLENTGDPIIVKVGCGSGCGPGNKYNYWVSSSNISSAAQQPGEDWSPPVGGGAEVTLTPTPTVPPATPTPAPPTPTPAPPTPTPTPPPAGDYYGCFSGVCTPIAYGDCPSIQYMLPNCGGQCVNPVNECH